VGVLLAVLALSVVVARSIHPTASSSSDAGVGAGRPVPPVAEESPPPSAPAIAPASPAARPVPKPPSPQTPLRAAPARVSGVVLSVDLKARTLVLQDMGAASEARRLRVGLAPDTRVVLSEREAPATDFKDTPISLSEIRDGDFVVVDMKPSEGTPLARSVVVTFRANHGAGGPPRPAN
jgi:hypothetical protein